MRARTAAWTICASSLAALAAGVGLQIATGRGTDDGLAEQIGLLVAFGSFPVLGAVVASKWPRNAVPWLFLAIGVSIGVLVLAMEYAHLSFVRDPGPRPLSTVVAWLEQWLWYPSFGFIALTLLLFPDGRPPSRRWTWLLWSMVALIATVVFLAMVPEYMVGEGYRIRNPIGIRGLGSVEEGVGGVLFLVFFAGTLLCLLSLGVRFKRSRGVERQQLKVFLFAAALFSVATFLDDVFRIPVIVFPLALMAIPASIGIAMTRFRLYDIDRIINRTIVYALVTGAVVAVYAATVGAVGTVVVGPSDNLTVAAATLAAAAAFRPVLNRVQSFVDRRFYRRKYDAAETIDAFGERLRQETDLDALTGDLASVVRGTMQPAHVSVWIMEMER